MSDLIDRQGAIMALVFSDDTGGMTCGQMAKVLGVIKAAPSAQTEQKRGKWIAVTEDGDVYKRICSCCGQEAFFQNDDPDELYDGGRYELSDFCPRCGADMRGVSE